MSKKHQQDEHSVCEECGASVYREHLDSGIARYEGGRLLCSVCVAEYERSHDAAAGAAGAEEYAPIEFEDEDDGGDVKAMSSTRIHSLSTATLGQAGAWDEAAYRRQAQPDGGGAIRCRTFHCRLSEGSVEYMNRQINEWIDSSDDIVVKFATTNVGLFEGKHTEPNLIVTVFY